jgi:hypothetical protein
VPTAFPIFSVSGIMHKRCQIVEKKYPVVVGPPFGDGGRDTFCGNTSPSEIIWEIEFDGLTQAEVATFDTHNDSALDTHLSFTFTDPETATAYTVKYLEYQRGTRQKRWNNRRLIRLIKRA